MPIDPKSIIERDNLCRSREKSCMRLFENNGAAAAEIPLTMWVAAAAAALLKAPKLICNRIMRPPPPSMPPRVRGVGKGLFEASMKEIHRE